jgi:hypothetical protein
VAVKRQRVNDGPIRAETCSKGKGKVHARTGHEVQRGGGKRDSPALSLTSALDGVGGKRHAPAALTPRKTRDPL